MLITDDPCSYTIPWAVSRYSHSCHHRHNWSCKGTGGMARWPINHCPPYLFSLMYTCYPCGGMLCGSAHGFAFGFQVLTNQPALEPVFSSTSDILGLNSVKQKAWLYWHSQWKPTDRIWEHIINMLRYYDDFYMLAPPLSLPRYSGSGKYWELGSCQ